MDIKELLPILAPVVLILGIVGLIKENKLRFKYHFGRLTSYLFAGGITMGIVFLVLDFGNEAATWIDFIPFGIAVLIFIIVLLRCPSNLKPTLFFAMFLAGWGVAMKVCLFFLPFLWKIGMPSEAEIRASQEAEERRRQLEQEKEEKRNNLEKQMWKETGERYIANDDATRVKRPYGEWQNPKDIL